MASLENRLDAAIDGLLAGNPAADLDPELSDLLAPALMLLSAPVPTPSQRMARGRMMAAVQARQQRPGLLARLGLGSRQALRLVPLAAVAVMVVLILLSGSALPGQPHYPLKRGVEALRLLGVQDPATRSVFYAELAEHRLSELEMLALQQRPIADSAIESIGQAWALAWSTPGADTERLQEVAADHASRLRVLIPLLPPQLRSSAQTVLDEITRFAGLADPSPTPTPAPSPTVLVSATPATPRVEIPDVPVSATAIPTSSPAATATATPIPTVTPSATVASTNTATSEATATVTAPPAATPTPDTQPTSPPAPTSTPVPPPARTPTQTVGPPPTVGGTPTPGVTETAENTRTLEPTEQPEETETPEREETETPEPEETETPESNTSASP